MTASSKLSSAAASTKNVAAIAGLLLIVGTSYWSASKFPTAFSSMGDLLSALVKGATPLATAIAAICFGVWITAAATKGFLFLLQFLVNFSVEDEDSPDVLGNRAPFFMKLRKHTNDEDRFYYTWKWEHSIFLGLVLQVVFTSRMGYLAPFF